MARRGNSAQECETGVVRSGYRLRMSPVRRWGTVVVLIAAGVFFVPGIVTAGFDLWWRALSVVGLVTAVLGLRAVLGSVLVVRDEGLRIQRSWPLRRDVRWYRMLQVDVIPGFWNLEVELNSGERLVLPCVDDVDRLYEEMERHRQALDA
jgi:hypothetical protein